MTNGVAFADEQAFDFDIPEQRADDALILLGKQADATVLFQYDMATQYDANRLQGEYTLPQAVDVLLASSGLKAEFGEQGHLYISVDDRQGREQMSQLNDDKNKKKKAGFAAFLAGLFSVSAGAQEPVDTDEAEEVLEEIIVVGSHIRGAVPVGSHVVTIDREAIERSGFATVHQVIQSMPQNFKGGVNEDTLGTSPESTSNINGGSSVNLRGLGSSATLTLVNGRRVPTAGRDSNFYDISTIPTSAIERVEVLSDGASAIYGSDAIAGVVNIILRDDFDGAETQLRYGGVTEGDLEEVRFAQTFGKVWKSGNALISYEYYDRGKLSNADRAFLADSDLTSLGGSDFSDILSNPGNITSVTMADGTVVGGQWAIPTGQDGTALTPSDLLAGAGIVNVNNRQEGGFVYGNQKRNSVFATLSQQLSDNFRLIAEGRYSERDYLQPQTGSTSNLTVPSSNAFFVDPFGGSTSVSIAYNFRHDVPLVTDADQKSTNALLGGEIQFENEWRLEFYGSYSRDESGVNSQRLDFAAIGAALANSNPTTAFNPFADGSNTNAATLATFVGADSILKTDSDVQSFNVVADGNLFELAGGTSKVAIGSSYREENFGKVGSTTAETTLERKVTAVFAEWYVPLVGQANSRPGLRRLDFSAAARYEKYTGIRKVSTTDPKLGILWSPVESLNIRGTWGTSFKAPNLADLDESRNLAFLTPLQDGAGFTQSLALFGGSADLENETATVWTVGADIKLEALKNFELNLTYFDVDFQNRVAAAANPFGLLLDETIFPHRIIRNPTQQELADACNSVPLFFSNPADCTVPPVAAIVNMGIQNESVTEVKGLDFDISYGVDTEKLGRFDFRIDGSYLVDFNIRASSGSPLVERVNTVGWPVDLRLRNTIGWHNYKGLSATAFINYTDTYVDNSVPSNKVDSWTTVGLTLSLNSSENDSASGIFSDVLLTLNLLNLFDEDPPFLNRASGGAYDPTNAHPMGRFFSINLTKKW